MRYLKNITSYSGKTARDGSPSWESEGSRGQLIKPVFVMLFVLVSISINAQKPDTVRKATPARATVQVDKALRPAKDAYYPAPLGFVSDYEKDFTPQQVQTMDSVVKDMLRKIAKKENLKGIELAVVTVTDSMFGQEKEMSDYATKLGDKWTVGKQGNKAIIIAYGKKIRKVAIVVGSGLDHILSPAACQEIMSNRMAPRFKEQKYYEAIMSALNGISLYLKLN